jgi:hypothetical protein
MLVGGLHTREGALTALTQKTSGRVAAILMVLALAATFLFIALRPARADSVGPIPNSGYSCASSTTGFFFEIPSGGDPDRVFTETFTPEAGVTLSVEVQTNRKMMDFTLDGAKAKAVAVYDKTNLRSGNLYTYDPGVVTGTVGTPGERNIKAVRVCYQTKADPTLTLGGSTPGGPGLAITNTATLAGGDSPTGMITWTAYTDAACTAGNEAGMDSATVNGNGEYTTPNGVSAAAGDYYWKAVYSGDPGNNPASSACGAETTIYLQTIACDDSATVDETGMGYVANKVSATRAEVDGKTTCDDYPVIPYDLEILQDVVSLDYPTTGDYADGARFLVKIEWNPADEAVDSNDPPNREVDYLLNGAFVTGPECTSSDQPNDEFPSVMYTYEHPANAPVCKAGEYLVGTDTTDVWQQIQWWDTIFDPQWR